MIRVFCLAVLLAVCAGGESLVCAGGESLVDKNSAGRYLQCRDGEIQLLPALAKEEMPAGRVSGLTAVGGFVFDIAWRENRIRELKVVSTRGGSCRIRVAPGLFSPVLHKAGRVSANPAIRATQAVAPDPAWPPSNFADAKHFPTECFDFETAPGEVLVMRGTAGRENWVKRVARFSDDFLKSDEARRIAQNVLDYQLASGGWPKNVPMDDPLSARDRAELLAQKGNFIKGTIDNGATMAELRFLARMHRATERQEYLDGFVRGIGFLLDLQYANGGWPQFDPKKGGYWAQITFNDGAMIGVMETLRQIYEARPPYDRPIGDALKNRCRQAFDKGVACILRTQIVQNGRKTIWCQQYDKDTLEPCIGRTFELPSLSTAESAEIVRLLMSLPRTPEIVAAVEDACAWWPAAAVRGYAIEQNWRRPDGVKTSRMVKVDPATNPPLWARYYTLEDNRPFWATRDSQKHFTWEELMKGENMTYQWWNRSGERIARDYANWRKTVVETRER